MSPTKNEKLIHIKLEYLEALQSKKDILSSQANLIRIHRIIAEYRKIRARELKVKLKVLRELRKLKDSFTKLNQTLPKLKIPKILQKEEEDFEIEKKPAAIKTTPKDDQLEMQLQEIQERLRELQ